jgi:hypothetical protein
MEEIEPLLATALATANLALVKFAGMPAMILRSALGADGYYELFVHPKFAEALVNLFMGYIELDPSSVAEWQAARKAAGTWFAQAGEAAYVKPQGELLKLMRESHDFVGAHALFG